MFCTNCRSAVQGHFCASCGVSAFNDSSLAAAGGLDGNVFVYPERVRLAPKSSVPWYYRQRRRENVRIPLGEVLEVEFREPTRLTSGRLRFRVRSQGAQGSEMVAVLFHKGQRDAFCSLKRAIDDCLESIAETSSAEMIA